METRIGRTAFGVLATVLGVMVLVGSSPRLAQADPIIIGNTATSGEIVGVTGADVGTISFTNNGEFLAVVVSASTASTLSTSGVTVTYNGALLIQAAQATRNGYSGVFYLVDPISDGFAHDLVVTLGTEGVPLAGGAWQFGVVSLSNMDEANPVALAQNWHGSGETSHTLLSPTLGDVDSGDFLLVSSAADNTAGGDPHYHTATDSQVSFYYSGNPAGAGAREYSALYALLPSGDLSDANSSGLADDVVMTTAQRTRAGVGVVFNAIPEPASLVLLAIGALVLMPRRR